jgi:hypothetical protein
VNAVSSLKVTPSVPLLPVCNTSAMNIVSLRLSGLVALLRITAALPSTVATLPIE